MKPILHKTIHPSFTLTLNQYLASFGILVSSLFYTLPAHAEIDIKVYKNPSCSCCGNWVKHLEENGFKADITLTKNRQPLQTQMGIPRDKGACHTAVINGYFIEGHVPSAEIKRLLDDKPDIAGLTVPGMPLGSPGMENPNYPAMDYQVLAIDNNGNSRVFKQYMGAKK